MTRTEANKIARLLNLATYGSNTIANTGMRPTLAYYAAVKTGYKNCLEMLQNIEKGNQQIKTTRKQLFNLL